MGRQTRFHMLEEDCKQFLGFVRQRDPVIVVDWSSKPGTMQEVQRPWERGGTYYLWNQSVLPTLPREGARAKPDILPVIQFWYPSPVHKEWNGRPALTQGRVWAQSPNSGKDFGSWYNALIRWIRKNFVSDPVLGDWVGPAAYRWFRDGGLLLPHFPPPVNTTWLSWVEAQDKRRSALTK